MDNTGLKKGINSQTYAEQYLEYLDGTAYTHILGIEYGFNDGNGPNPFRIIERGNGNLLLSDISATASYAVLCQYDCSGKVGKDYNKVVEKLCIFSFF